MDPNSVECPPGVSQKQARDALRKAARSWSRFGGRGELSGLAQAFATLTGDLAWREPQGMGALREWLDAQKLCDTPLGATGSFELGLRGLAFTHAAFAPRKSKDAAWDRVAQALVRALAEGAEETDRSGSRVGMMGIFSSMLSPEKKDHGDADLIFGVHPGAKGRGASREDSAKELKGADPFISLHSCEDFLDLESKKGAQGCLLLYWDPTLGVPGGAGSSGSPAALVAREALDWEQRHPELAADARARLGAALERVAGPGLSALSLAPNAADRTKGFQRLCVKRASEFLADSALRAAARKARSAPADSKGIEAAMRAPLARLARLGPLGISGLARIERALATSWPDKTQARELGEAVAARYAAGVEREGQQRAPLLNVARLLAPLGSQLEVPSIKLSERRERALSGPRAPSLRA